jgi:YVTN family beta-propeller protein
MIYVSRDLQRIITTNVSSGTVSIIEKIAADGPAGAPPPPSAKGPGNSGTRGAQAVAQPGRPKTDWNETLISVGSGSEGFDVSPDGKEAWVANAGDGTVSIIDLSAKKVIRTLDAKVVGANRLKFTPDGKRVLISSLRGTDLVILDASEHKEIKRLPIGHGAAGILMQPDGSRAFVACTPDNYVTVIALPSLEVAGRIQDIGQPDGLAWAVRP